MIRTTISKIKKVCTIAFVPRLLRGNLRYTPSIYAAFGKFEKFTSAVKSVRKSTKATGDDDPLQPTDSQLKDNMSVGTLSKPLNNDIEICFAEQNVRSAKPDILFNTPAEAVSPLYASTPGSQDDKCKKVLSEIFGDENARPADLLVMNHVNMSSDMNYGKLITDKKTQINIFGKYDSKAFKTTPHVKVESSDSSGKSKDFQSVLCYEAVVLKEKEARQAKQVKEDLNTKTKSANVDNYNPQLYTSLYDVDPEEYLSQWKLDTRDFKMPAEKYTDQEIDAYWTDVHETAIENNVANYKPNQAIDLETLNVYRTLKGESTDAKDTATESKRIKHTPEELERIMCGSPYNIFRDTTVKSTTQKQDEETLAQKLEHIDETPLVEAEKTKVEGFNVPPKVLGNKEKAASIVNKNLDEVAHRCLNLPETQIDKMLLKEMEKISVPATAQRPSGEVKIAGALDTGILNTSRSHDVKKMPENSDMGNTNSLNEFPNNLTGLGGMKLNPSTLEAEKQYWYNLNRTKMSEEPKRDAQLNIKTPEKTENNKISSENIKQTCSKDNAFKERPDITACSKVDELVTGQTPQATAESPKPSLSKPIWVNERLDPKHILTCNETCPISPKPIIDAKEPENLETAEALFGRSVLTECIPKQKEMEDLPKPKLGQLTDAGCGSYALREINRERYKSSKGNASEAKSLDAYMKTLKAATCDNAAGRPIIEEKPNIESNKEPITEPESNATRLPRLEDVAQFPQLEGSPQMPLVLPINYIQQIATMTAERARIAESAWAAAKKSSDIVSTETTEQPAAGLLMEGAINPTKLEPEPCTVPEDVTNKPIEKTRDITDAYLVETIQATSEKLQATSEQLQATSEQLQATSEQLEAASEQLYVTSEKLQSTTDHLEQACEKLDLNNELIEEARPLRKSEDADPSVEADHPMNPPEKSDIKPENDPMIKATITPSMDSKPTPTMIPPVATVLSIKETDLTKSTSGASKPSPLQNPGTAISSTLPNKENIPIPLHIIKDDIKLSELMKIVKERNKQIDSSKHLLSTIEAKKSIPPMQQPRHKTPVFKPPGYPKLKPRPKTCLPRRKSAPKKNNCSRCDPETLGLDSIVGPQFTRNEASDSSSMYQQNGQGLAVTNDVLPLANLTEEIIVQLQNMGYILESAYNRSKIRLESAVLARTQNQEFRSKDYEPWVPIPSWPHTKKEKRAKVQCPKDGCPAPPPRSVHDPPCGLKPCKSFPTYPKRTFSVLDYCPISLGDPKVVDIGEF